MAKPLSPKEVKVNLLDSFPDGVVEAFNELIQKNVRQRKGYLTAEVAQDDVVTLITTKMQCSRDLVFEAGWLDIEPLFRRHGWRVEYDKPQYYETNKAKFVFSASTKAKETDA